MMATVAGAAAAYSGAITAGAAVVGAGAAIYSIDQQRKAAKDAQAAADAAANFEFEMPSFEAPKMPDPPTLPDAPKPPAPAPTTDQAARRSANEAAQAKSRRRTLSIFASSPSREGRSSTILTSSVGAPGKAPVRRRALGGATVLGAS